MGAEVLLDVSDLLEFYGRGESSSGVQRVIEGVAPPLMARGCAPVCLDRSRGALVAVDQQTFHSLLRETDRATRASTARAELNNLSRREEVTFHEDSVVLFPGAVWISDAMMLAAWRARQQGTRMVFLLYDLTPVMEAGHTAAVNKLFDRYLHLISGAGDRVPAISESSRQDFVAWCTDRGRPIPDGVATRLPNGIRPDDYEDWSRRPWPREYVLMVGTIEARKNHALALEAWSTLIDRHGADNVPDLLCVGRLGWHSDEFLQRLQETDGLGGKVHVMTSNISDVLLASMYRNCEFTIYPSRYEGWGLPVSESLAFGKLPIVADNSSLPEAGRDLAVYFDVDEPQQLVDRIDRFGLDVEERRQLEAKIQSSPHDEITWDVVADVLWEEVRRAQEEPGVAMSEPKVEVGREYMLSPTPLPPDGAHADQFADYLAGQARTPLLGQVRGTEDFTTTDQLLTGQFGVPQVWGLEIHPDRQMRVGFTRPIDGELSMLFATRSMPGHVRVSVVSPVGDVRHDVYLGSVLRIDFGDGAAGDTAIAYFTVIDAEDSVEGFMGVESFVIMRSDDSDLEATALRAAARALRQELDFMTASRSWRLTAPLRRRWGREGGSS